MGFSHIQDNFEEKILTRKQSVGGESEEAAPFRIFDDTKQLLVRDACGVNANVRV